MDHRKSLCISDVSTVNEILLQIPLSSAVLNRFGVDTCSDGARPLVDVAREAGAEPEDIMLALAAAIT